MPHSQQATCLGGGGAGGGGMGPAEKAEGGTSTAAVAPGGCQLSCSPPSPAPLKNSTRRRCQPAASHRVALSSHHPCSPPLSRARAPSSSRREPSSDARVKV